MRRNSESIVSRSRISTSLRVSRHCDKSRSTPWQHRQVAADPPGCVRAGHAAPSTHRIRRFRGRRNRTSYLAELPSTRADPHKDLHSDNTVNSRLTRVRSAAMKKLFPAMAVMIPLIGVAATPDTVATAHADQVAFAPDRPNHRKQTKI